MSKMFKSDDERIIIDENNEKVITENKKSSAFNFKFDLIFWVISFFLVLFDQLTKWLAIYYLGPLSGSASTSQIGNKLTFIPGFIDWNLIINRGSAFGLGDGNITARIIFILISWLVMIGIILFLVFKAKKTPKGFRILLYFILAGDIGNLIDRTFYFNKPNGVIDFIDINPFFKSLGFKEPNFGIFNVADAILVCSLFALIIYVLVGIIKDAINENKRKNIEK